ncbi:MAG: glycosyltransferase [Flavobacteriales bacterium]|nr:glycosyltransferase [Flavobacteriales bacterium]
MKVLFTTDQIYLHGGIEKVMAEKANWFADVYHYQVYILTTEQKDFPPCYPLNPKIILKDLGVNYQREKSYFSPSNIKKIPFHYSQWKKAIKEIEPDVLISCNYAFDFYWIPFCFKSLPKLKEYHSSRYFENQNRNKTSFFGGLKYKINDFIESKFTKIILLNQDEISFYRSKNTVVIPNPIQIKTTDKALLSNNKAIAAGRIAPVKGFDVMISVWSEVVKVSPDWELHLYGQGESNYINLLKNKIVSLNLANKVFIHDATNKLNEKMIDSSLYIMTSKTECYPMVLLESLTLGVPVVSFDCPTGPRHIVKDGATGFITANQNIDEIAQKIVLLIQNKSLREEFGTKAFNYASIFQPEKIMPLWKELFDKLKS